MNDPLQDFAVWEGGPLAPDSTRPAGFYGEITPPGTHMHIAGGHCTSSVRIDSQAAKHPAVYLRLAAGVVGTGPRYHVLTGVIDAGIATELGECLIEAAKQSALDLEAAT